MRSDPGICRLRQPKCRSQEEFAHEAGLHWTHVSDLERGARNLMITVVNNLAAAPDLTVGRLLE
ncbi:helix-turn-helix domain-containing protein [Albidovulum sediminicola]|uniref:Helix-turn-helix domain-containing protein n=1 Tax=Albidovulum sediminicola TaxID=2984331 RepID=A0ABT2Z038_9RHOB|nr:helix-turn-helix transcriptional regulator [Defluviimonas sp. WL0075]MCV2864415.1 helix-turn-helix domain-containing protein [Defluviimonas sp. WL0075]